MARFLCVVPPFVAHVIQMSCVAAALEERGNEVAWVAHNAMRRYLPADAIIFEPPRGDRDLYAQALERSRQPFLAGFQSFWEDMLLPLAETMMQTVEQAVAACAPDVMFVDQQALAGALVARKLGMRWATSSPSALLVTRDIEVSPQFQRWVASLYEQLQRDAGLEPVDDLDLSPHLVIIYSSAMMATGTLPKHYQLVGPPLDGRKEEAVDTAQLRPGRRIYVSLGTSGRYEGNRTFDVVREAFADDDLQVIVAAPEGMLSEPPANFLVRDWLPQVEIMHHVDAAIIHGGSNTTNEALAAGLPLVILPLAFDQFGYAERVAELGASIRLRHRRVTPAELRSSLHEVMEKPSYRQAAQRIQQSFREAGGAAAASLALESLAASSLEDA